MAALTKSPVNHPKTGLAGVTDTRALPGGHPKSPRVHARAQPPRSGTRSRTPWPARPSSMISAGFPGFVPISVASPKTGSREGVIRASGEGGPSPNTSAAPGHRMAAQGVYSISRPREFRGATISATSYRTGSAWPVRRFLSSTSVQFRWIDWQAWRISAGLGR